MKNMKPLHLLGFTLIEVLIAISIMTAAAAYAVPYMMTRVDIAKAHKAADEAKGWLEAGIAYYAANSAWPADANTLVTAGYMQSSDLNNPWGGTYSLAINGSSLQVSTAFSKFPEIGKERLPLSAVSGSTVTARVTPPGTEAAHSRLLNRYGDAGNNRMYAALEMGGNNINQTNTLGLNRQNDGAVNLGALSYPDSNAGLKISTGSSSDPITIWTNGSEKVRVANSGDVGIGTTVPNNKLDIKGNLEVGAASRGAILRSSATDNFQLHTWASTPNPNFDIGIGDGAGGIATTWLHGDSAGNVGIGTTSPLSRLHVKGETTVQNDVSAIRHYDTAGNLKFLTGLRSDVSPGNFVFYSYGGDWIFNSGTVRAPVVQLTAVYTAGTGCSPNGLQAIDNTGGLLSCKNGVWTAPISSFGVWASAPLNQWVSVASDGIVHSYVTSSGQNLQCFVNGSAGFIELGRNTGGGEGSCSFAVRKGESYYLAGGNVGWWLPFQ